MREAAVYVIVLMLPLAFAAMVWPARRIWAIRAIELLVALILSKFAIVAVLSLGGAALFAAERRAQRDGCPGGSGPAGHGRVHAVGAAADAAAGRGRQRAPPGSLPRDDARWDPAGPVAAGAAGAGHDWARPLRLGLQRVAMTDPPSDPGDASGRRRPPAANASARLQRLRRQSSESGDIDPRVRRKEARESHPETLPKPSALQPAAARPLGDRAAERERTPESMPTYDMCTRSIGHRTTCGRAGAGARRRGRRERRG